jgi:hypothetical protein
MAMFGNIFGSGTPNQGSSMKSPLYLALMGHLAYPLLAAVRVTYRNCSNSMVKATR